MYAWESHLCRLSSVEVRWCEACGDAPAAQGRGGGGSGGLDPQDRQTGEGETGGRRYRPLGAPAAGEQHASGGTR
ncbi:hypothetical protein GCM10010295_35850 [Streptomyces intermedius]